MGIGYKGWEKMLFTSLVVSILTITGTDVFSQEKVKAGYPSDAASRTEVKAPVVSVISKSQARTNTELKTVPSVPESYRNHPELGKIKLENSPESVELIQNRTADSRVFINPDGTYTKIQSSGNMHHKNANGHWLSIQSNPSSNSKNSDEFGITETDKPILVNTKTGISRMVLDNQKAIEFTNDVTMEIADANGNVLLQNTKSNNTVGSRNNSEVTFTDYWNNTDRIQQIQMESLKINYIIKSLPSGIPSDGYVIFKEKIIIPSNWQIRKSGEGQGNSIHWFGELEVTNESGIKIGTFEKLVFFDSSADSEIQGGYILEKTTNGYFISTMVPAQWLLSASRAFPVTIDPTLTNTYSSGNIGSSFNTFCTVNMNVNIPANSTVSSTLIQSTYQTLGTTKKRNARISYTGPGGTIGEYYCDENANGSCNLSHTSSTLANGFYSSGVVPFSINVKRNSNSGASCSSVNLYIVNNSWTVTLTYTTCATLTSGGTITGMATAACGQTLEYTCAGGSGTYQWQTSTNGGTSYTSISGATSSSLSLSFNAANTYTMRVVRSNSNCVDSYSSTQNTVVAAGSTGQSTVNPHVVSSLPYSGIHATHCFSAGYSGTNNQLTPAKFFKFTTGSCATSITINTCHPSSEFDTYIHLLNSSGTQISSNDDVYGCGYTINGNHYLSMISNFAVLPNTVYYVVVQAYRYSVPSSGVFGLNVTEGSGNSVVPNVSVSGSLNICQNGVVNLQAVPINGGTTPTYNWLKNGLSTGITTSNFSTSNVSNGDVITVSMTSSNPCASPAIIMSSANNIVVTSGSTVSLSSNSPLCDGSNLLLNANVSETPVSFSWTGSNGYTSNQQNPVISNVTAANSGNYSVTVINGFGCSSTNTTNVSISTPMLSSISNFQNPSCTGQSNGTIQTAVSGGTLPYSYIWSNGGSTSSAINLIEGIYTVTIYDANGCTSVQEQELTASVPVSSAVAGTNKELCNQLSINLEASTPSSGSGLWSVVSGTGVFSDATSPVSSVSNLSTSQVNIFKWTVSNSCNSSNDDVSINVSTTPPPNQPIMSGPLMGCKDDTLNYATNLVATTLIWEARPEGEIISGQGTQNATIIFGNTTTSGYHACVTGSNACGTNRAKCVVVRSNSSTPYFKEAPIDVCDGTTTNFKIRKVGGATSYQWTAPANILINGSQSPYITTDTTVSIYFPLGYGSAKISVASSAGCDYGAKREITISSTPLLPYNITGLRADLCNTVQTYYIRTRVNQTYSWSVPNGATILYTSPATDSITVQFGSAVTGNIIVRAINICGTLSPERKLRVTSFPSTPGIVSGPIEVCPNTGGYNFTVLPVPNATEYLWTLPSGALITSGERTNSVEVQFGSVITNIMVQAVGPCGTSTKRTLKIESNCRLSSSSSNNNEAVVKPNTNAVDFNLQAYPDAQSRTLTVTFNAVNDATYQYKILNEANTELMSGEIDVVAGSNMEQIDMSALPNATYRIVVENGTTINTLNIRFF